MKINLQEISLVIYFSSYCKNKRSKDHLLFILILERKRISLILVSSINFL